MTALAEVLVAMGCRVRGSDTAEVFYTDAVLRTLGIRYIEEFTAANVDAGYTALIYSAAYDPDTHPELVRARELGIPRYTYAEALGELSRERDATGIAGVHGKSTLTSLLGVICRELELPITTVVGSKVPQFGNTAAWVGGAEALVAETCEYRRHFLSFHPDRIVVTSIEADHLDYYRDANDVAEAFFEYALRLPRGGLLIFCADDTGAAELGERVARERPDVRLLPYGIEAAGHFGVTEVREEPGVVLFRLRGWDAPFRLHIPGAHNAMNATASVAAAADIVRALDEEPGEGSDSGAHSAGTGGCEATLAATLTPERLDRVRAALSGFRGLKRRSEVVGEASGITVMDDYAHHPRAITATLEALRRFYPGRRIVLDFMSHTYSRTEALFDELAEALSVADELVLHKIYASAREASEGSVSGALLAEAIERFGSTVHYVEEPEDAVDLCRSIVRPGDIFLTMGAGNNWQVGSKLLRVLSGTAGPGGTAGPDAAAGPEAAPVSMQRSQTADAGQRGDE